VLVDEVDRAVARAECRYLAAVLDQLYPDALSYGGVRLLGLYSDLL